MLSEPVYSLGFVIAPGITLINTGLKKIFGCSDGSNGARLGKQSRPSGTEGFC